MVPFSSRDALENRKAKIWVEVLTFENNSGRNRNMTGIGYKPVRKGEAAARLGNRQEAHQKTSVSSQQRRSEVFARDTSSSIKSIYNVQAISGSIFSLRFLQSLLVPMFSSMLICLMVLLLFRSVGSSLPYCLSSACSKSLALGSLVYYK